MRLQIQLSSTVLLRPVQVTVALPDGFSKWTPPYRTVWALHAAMSDADIFFGALGVENFVQKDGFAFIAPSLGNGYFVNMGYERQADFLNDELLPELRQILPLATDRKDNALLGISMGGYGALRWGLDFPMTFSTITIFSGVFERQLPDHPMLRKKRELRALHKALSPIMRHHFQEDDGRTRLEADLQLLLERNSDNFHGIKLPKVRFFCGLEDYLALPHCEDMVERLHAVGGIAKLYLLHGSHDTNFWAGIMSSALSNIFDNGEVEQ